MWICWIVSDKASNQKNCSPVVCNTSFSSSMTICWTENNFKKMYDCVKISGKTGHRNSVWKQMFCQIYQFVCGNFKNYHNFIITIIFFLYYIFSHLFLYTRSKSVCTCVLFSPLMKSETDHQTQRGHLDAAPFFGWKLWRQSWRC